MRRLRLRTTIRTVRVRRVAAATLVMAGLTLVTPGSTQQAGVAEIAGLVWATGTNGENVPWEDANAYCDTLELAGRDDWRLPTLAELETLHDPAAAGRGQIRAPLELEDCCAWSSTSFAELPADRKGVLPEPLAEPEAYYWGFLFAGGIRYYSLGRFPDGEALCVRDAG